MSEVLAGAAGAIVVALILMTALSRRGREDSKDPGRVLLNRLLRPDWHDRDGP